ncbi:hypothetical protein G9A89_018326 [Geosiphon pyriformis]|nr:hypothetical protein G9A89_018326 [Geosiphon pyriformis]
MKLFCVEFASQQSLETAFLVKLTSSVRLTTLKIAKSLVVSEFGSFSANVALHDIPLSVSIADIKTALSVFGEVACVQYMVVYFKELNVATVVLNHWLILVGKNSVRIFSVINQNKAILFRDKFKAKLVNLSSGCTAFEISDMISQVGGRMCFIPQSLDSGHHSRFALITFDFQDNLDSAVVKTSTLRKCHIWWKTPGCWHCFRYQEIDHLAADCKVSPLLSSKAPKIFNTHFVSGVFYAKASAPLNISGFFSLVASDLLALPLAAFFVAPVADSTVELRLNSMEKQILDLTALVKSVIEPIGSLVTLVTTLLNDNAVKALKVKKDLLTMCNASKSFADLLVGMSKNFASLKTEVKFGNLDDDDIGAAKTFLLSKNTIDYAVVLWQMCGSEVKGSSKKTRLFFSEFIFDSRNLNSVIKRLGELGFLLASFDSA